MNGRDLQLGFCAIPCTRELSLRLRGGAELVVLLGGAHNAA